MTTELRPKHIVLSLLFLSLISYAGFQGRAILTGPEIFIENIRDGSVVHDPLVVLEGKARNISWISLNDRQIFTDEEGRWSEKLIVSSGTSIMTFKARDRFGHEIEKSLQIILN